MEQVFFFNLCRFVYIFFRLKHKNGIGRQWPDRGDKAGWERWIHLSAARWKHPHRQRQGLRYKNPLQGIGAEAVPDNSYKYTGNVFNAFLLQLATDKFVDSCVQWRDKSI